MDTGGLEIVSDDPDEFSVTPKPEGDRRACANAGY